MILYLVGVVSLFLLSYFIFFVKETVMLKRNPRPKMSDTCNIRFKDVHKIKTHNFGVIESR